YSFSLSLSLSLPFCYSFSLFPSLIHSFSDTLQKHQFVFTCLTAEGKDYPIQASTRDEMLVWVKAIEDAKEERNRRPPSGTATASVNPGAGASKPRPPNSSATSPNGATGKGAANKDKDSSDDSDDD
ncbi:hypothetical protein GBAR_LOCUS22819, partial [Geodia barretti]